MRSAAVATVLKSFKMQIPISVLSRWLGLHSDEQVSVFLETGGHVIVAGAFLDVDQSKASAKAK